MGQLSHCRRRSTRRSRVGQRCWMWSQVWWRPRSKLPMIGRNVVSKENAITDNISAGGIDGIALRTLVSSAARRNWTLASVDVKMAFLQAARRETPGRMTLIQPPGMVRESGLLKNGPREMWQVTGAMYGLPESPKDWSVHGDRVMPQICWTSPIRWSLQVGTHRWISLVESVFVRGEMSECFCGGLCRRQGRNLWSPKSWTSSMASSNWHRWSGLDRTHRGPFAAFRLA